MKRYPFIISLILILSLSACSTDILYSRFTPIPSGEWHMDSVVRFDYQIADTTRAYNVIVHVRHTERYPYQNMWLFIGDSLYRDTVEFYLADDRGRWLGDKHNGFVEMPVLLDEARYYTHPGSYCVTVQHGMRDTLLRGVTDIGLEITYNGQE